jgi:hypothetical protein
MSAKLQEAPAANWNHIYCVVQVVPRAKICTVAFCPAVIYRESDKIFQLTGHRPKVIIFTRDELISLNN